MGLRRRVLAAAATLPACLALAGTAGAYLSATGSGSGAGSAAVGRTVVISESASAAGATLLPTGTRDGSVLVRLTNPTAGPLHVGRLVLDTGRGSGGYSTAAVACKLDFAAQDNGGKGWTLAAGATADLELPRAVLMGTDAPSSCQGQALDLYLKTA